MRFRSSWRDGLPTVPLQEGDERKLVPPIRDRTRDLLKRSGGGNLRRDVRAFTLLEMLIALGIFAFAVIGLMMALEHTVDAARLTQEGGAVRNGIENRLARLSVGRLRPIANEETIGGVTFFEKVDREEVRNEENIELPGFWRIRVVARWSEPAGEQEWEASHLVYRSNE